MPGPRPTCYPTFPETFLQRASAEIRRKSAVYRTVQRYQLALLLHERPQIGHEAAGRPVGLSADQVRRWRKRWRGGDFSVADRAGRGRKATFSPLDAAIVKALACEQVAHPGQPLNRQSLADITARAEAALGKAISRRTGWRILAHDALKPWRYRYWIFPRDPRFAEKAAPIVDLYAGQWQA
jgi:hypothetical protein